MTKYFPPNTKGIIAWKHGNETPERAIYGTFADFMNRVKSGWGRGFYSKTPYTGEHDGYEKKSMMYIEDWVEFKGKKGHLDIEFHTIRRYIYGKEGYTFIAPTVGNDTTFKALYAPVL